MIYPAPEFRAPAANWLNKLRAAKGFPPEPDLPIEDFFTSLHSISPRESQAGSLALEGSRISVAHTSRIDSLTKVYSSRSSSERGLHHRDGRAQDCAAPSESRAFCTPNGFPCGAQNNVNAVTESDCVRSSITEAASALRISGAKRAVRDSGGGGDDAREENSSVDLSSQSCLLGYGGARKPINSRTLSDLPWELGVPRTRQPVNVFADIFCMDDSSDETWNDQPAGSTKKHKRKQEKPKLCPTLSDSEPPCTTTISSQLQLVECDDHRLDEMEAPNPALQSENDVDGQNKVDAPSSSAEMHTLEETLPEQKSAGDSPANSRKRRENIETQFISRNEIFVIDTSLQGWKVEKIVLRKGSSWKVKDKCMEAGLGNSKSTMNVSRSKKRARTHMKSETPRVRRQWHVSSFLEKGDKRTREPMIVIEGWRTVPQTQLRSHRRRRKSAHHEGGISISKKAQLTEGEPAAAVLGDNISIPEQSDEALVLAPDHPANQPKEALIFSIYQVFMQAGKTGLTAREAVSRILEQGLPGLHEGGVVPRVEVLKIISNSPYFMMLEESKYILCSALVGDDNSAYREPDVQNDQHSEHDNGNECFESVKREKQCGVSQYWAACAAIRRARTGKTRRKPLLGSRIFNPFPTQEIGEAIAGFSQKKCLKSVKQEVTGLGNPCNRSDGKGWHCPLRAKVGYLLCDHHLDRLRVKSHSKSKMLSLNKPSSENRKLPFGDSWMVKKVVERSRIGRVASGREAQSNLHAQPFEASRSNDFIYDRA